MTFVLMTRHPHMNDTLNRYLTGGDIVAVEDPAVAEKLLSMRGGVSYGHNSFDAFSGAGFSYFSPVNFNLETLALELSKSHKEAKVVSAPAAPKVSEEVKEEVAPEPEAVEAPKPRARKQQ